METVVIAGGTGMIGRKISTLLKKEGYITLSLTRNKKITDSQNFTYWNPKKGEIDQRIKEADHIINLAGTGIADKRWSQSRKKEIIESRTLSTNLLIRAISDHGLSIKTFSNASAVGYYGNRGSKLLSESSPNGSDFLAQVCRLWEDAAMPAKKLVNRFSIIRIGVVLSKEGGALSKMDATVPYGISSILGSGKQYMPWIHIDDLANMFLESIRNSEINGIYNAVSPNPEAQKGFAKALKRALYSRAILMPTPAFLLKTLLGEMSAVVLNSTNVSAQKIVDTGFEFQYPHLDAALHEIYKE
ncbi:MAG: hypothetical protein ACI9FN_000115 [Saprospiraceae bacterium]|jgi:uncharacterized protein (TIGR01777 family)